MTDCFTFSGEQTNCVLGPHHRPFAEPARLVGLELPEDLADQVRPVPGMRLLAVQRGEAFGELACGHAFERGHLFVDVEWHEDLVGWSALNPVTPRPTEPRIRPRLKAFFRGLWNFFVRHGRDAHRRLLEAQHSPREDRGALGHALLGCPFGIVVGHVVRLLER
jgi:hypothetical protein